MAQRRSPHRLPSSPSSSYHRKTKLPPRHSSAARRALAFVNKFQRSTISSHASRASAPSSSDTVSVRPILATLQPNLRRLPSRHYLHKTSMRDVGHNFDVPVGSKRKRVVSLNENAHANGRPMHGSGRPKRRRGTMTDSEGDDEATSMDVDPRRRWSGSDDSEVDSDRNESSDEFLINEASTRQLLRLRKDELVRLYVAAGLSDDTETLTKPDLVNAIISARDDIASLPPSSPPGRGDGNSSDFSSDDGNIAGDDETDVGAKYSGASLIRRRATVNGMNQMTTRALKARSLSLGQCNTRSCPVELSVVPEQKIDPEAATRRRNTRLTSTRSSPIITSSNPLPSPPATRLRTRRGSGEQPSSQFMKAKAKPKQVEFSEDVQARSPSSSGDESELTDLAELEAKIAATSRSPRRLRSREKVNAAHCQDATPRQRIRCKGATDQEQCGMEENRSMEEAEDGDEEVDELISSPSPSPPPENGRRTPLKRRLRPRRMQTHTPPRDDGSEGDDEEEEEDQVAEDMMEEMDDEDVENLHEHEDVGVNGSPSPVRETTPRKLRSGKVVGGGEYLDGNEDEEIEDHEDQEVDLELESVDVDAESADDDVDLDADADEAMEEDDFDLTLATKKTLIRLRRDDLVRLCETRDLDVVGTKPQLALSLLQWRDRHANGFSSPSSTGTVRPPSTMRVRGGRRRTKSRSQSNTPPMLTRARVHQDELQTIPMSNGQQDQPEAELELDLESLGLDDREIPPDKLTKLEKIGSGGFKDVYIGKFKGRRVAIAEFRDQLSSMDIKELKLLGEFDHPNIVRFLGVSIPENTRETPVMIVSELCSNGDLFDYIRNVPAPSLYKVLSMMLDIAHGLDYLHARKPSIIHRDCKSSNILITSRCTAKIADFGLAKVKQSTRSMVRSVVGTVNWQAPELWHAHPKYNHKADVFSCAMVFWEMLQWHLPTKRFPWEGMNEHAIYETVGAKRQRPPMNGIRKQYCPEIVALIECMWAHDPAERPTMFEVVQKLEELVATYR